jgi:hypothetical protein
VTPTREGELPVCRNIKVLFNFDPPASDDEIRAAARQYVRKISGYAIPSAANEGAFERAVDEVSAASSKLLGSLTTTAHPRDRDAEAEKAHERALVRFGSAPASSR